MRPRVPDSVIALQLLTCRGPFHQSLAAIFLNLGSNGHQQSNNVYVRANLQCLLYFGISLNNRMLKNYNEIIIVCLKIKYISYNITRIAQTLLKL